VLGVALACAFAVLVVDQRAWILERVRPE